MNRALATVTFQRLTKIAKLYKEKPQKYMDSKPLLVEIMLLSEIISCELDCYKLY